MRLERLSARWLGSLIVLFGVVALLASCAQRPGPSSNPVPTQPSVDDPVTVDNDPGPAANNPIVTPTTEQKAEERDEKPKPVSRILPNDLDEAGEETESGIVSVAVYYGTDRRRTGDQEPNETFGGETLGKLEVGVLQVSIPPVHETGRVEQPSVWKMEWYENPERHVMLRGIKKSSSEQAWVKELQATGHNSAYIFVHGYNNGFAKAARRAGQMAYDLDYPGTPIMYSWPSQGSPAGYNKDEEMVELAAPHFKRFLDLVTKEAGYDDVHVVAHSMGNRLVARVMREMVLAGDTDQRLNQLILAAPDIDASRFKQDFADKLPKLAKRTTLYVSANDKALIASKELRSRPRAGDPEGGLLGIEAMDTIDASSVDTDFLAHAYYANSTTLLSDLHCLLLHGTPPEKRQLLKQGRSDRGAYWTVMSPEESQKQGADPRTCQ